MAERGRPPVVTKEVLRKLEEAFIHAFTDKEACLYADISTTALYDYCQDHPAFAERKETLKMSPRLHAKRTIMTALQNKNLETAKWYAIHKMGDEFAPKSKVEHSGGIESTTNPEQARTAAADALRERFEVELRESIVKGPKAPEKGKQAPISPTVVVAVSSVVPGQMVTEGSGQLTV